MKRIGSLFLALGLLTCLLAPTSYAAEDTVTAVPTAANVIVNNEVVTFEAYNINDNNFFKLRDLAYALNGTDKGFNVDWSHCENSIFLTSGESYTPVGGEMEVTGAYQAQTSLPVQQTSSIVYLDGKRQSLTAYNINGNNYFMLREILGIFDIYCAWDSSTRDLYIDSFAQKEVTVSTAAEFVAAVASNTLIRLEPGVYDLTEYTGGGTNGFEISGLNNLAIIGAGADKTELINADRFMDILYFSSCRDISVSGVKAGHTPQEYECDAGVFYFNECMDVSVSDCYLYGCGSVGIHINNCTVVAVENTTITDCSLRAVDIYDSTYVLFDNCSLTDNRCYAAAISVYAYQRPSIVMFNYCDISGNYNIEWGLIDANIGLDGHVLSLVFVGCTFSDNKRAEGYNPYLFDISGHSVVLNQCTVTDNEMSYEYNPALSRPEYVNCEFSGNAFAVN